MTLLLPMQVPESPSNATRTKLMADVALVSNYICRHQLPVYESIQRRVKRLDLLMSVAMEPQRDYAAQFGDLRVRIQKNWTLRREWRHPVGFRDPLHVHIPWDTYFQLRRIRPSVIVSYELGMRSLLCTLYRRLHSSVRLVTVVNVSEHTEKAWGASRARLRNWILRNSDIVTYNGPSGRRYLLSRGVPKEKLYSAPYAAHAGSVHRGSVHRSPRSRRRLLYVGQMTERKYIVGFLRQLSVWCSNHPETKVELTLVGRGPLRESIEAFITPENLSLKLIGSVDPSDMPKVWEQHGILVFPTLADEWGMVVNEALHSGLPVLGSVYAQASITLLRESVNGWLFVPNRDRDMQAAIHRMMQTSNEQLGAMAEAARLSVDERTSDWAAQQFVEAIEAAMNTRPRTKKS